MQIVTVKSEMMPIAILDQRAPRKRKTPATALNKYTGPNIVRKRSYDGGKKPESGIPPAKIIPHTSL
jgi:hypothetical protein